MLGQRGRRVHIPLVVVQQVEHQGLHPQQEVMELLLRQMLMLVHLALEAGHLSLLPQRQAAMAPLLVGPGVAVARL